MIQLYNNLPTLDLHGFDRDYARISINDFIRDNYNIGNISVIIVHGNGTGTIKKTTQETLRKNKMEDDYYKFREEYLKNMAIDWCKKNNIEYEKL